MKRLSHRQQQRLLSIANTGFRSRANGQRVAVSTKDRIRAVLRLRSHKAVYGGKMLYLSGFTQYIDVAGEKRMIRREYGPALAGFDESGQRVYTQAFPDRFDNH